MRVRLRTWWTRVMNMSRDRMRKRRRERRRALNQRSCSWSFICFHHCVLLRLWRPRQLSPHRPRLSPHRPRQLSPHRPQRGTRVAPVGIGALLPGMSGTVSRPSTKGFLPLGLSKIRARIRKKQPHGTGSSTRPRTRWPQRRRASVHVGRLSGQGFWHGATIPRPFADNCLTKSRISHTF